MNLAVLMLMINIQAKICDHDPTTPRRVKQYFALFDFTNFTNFTITYKKGSNDNFFKQLFKCITL